MLLPSITPCEMWNIKPPMATFRTHFHRLPTHIRTSTFTRISRQRELTRSSSPPTTLPSSATATAYQVILSPSTSQAQRGESGRVSESTFLSASCVLSTVIPLQDRGSELARTSTSSSTRAASGGHRLIRSHSLIPAKQHRSVRS